MGNIMILAPFTQDGERYARKHGLNRSDVITPISTDHARGRAFDDYIIVGDVRLDVDQWAALTPALLQAGEEVLERFYYEAQGKLPPPIELPRVSVVRF